MKENKPYKKREENRRELPGKNGKCRNERESILNYRKGKKRKQRTSSLKSEDKEMKQTIGVKTQSKIKPERKWRNIIGILR